MKQLKTISLILLLSFYSFKVIADETAHLVSVVPLSSVLIPSLKSAPANIISLNASTISAEITGRATKINAEVGDSVEKGQNLASIDCRSYELAKKQAEAALKMSKAQQNLAKKQLTRNKRLIKNGTIPREIFDQTEANLQTALADIEVKKAAIDTAQLSIDRCSIAAPFSGQITERLVQQGQLLIAGSPLFKLIQDDKMEVTTRLSPADIVKFGENTQIHFIAGNYRSAAKIRSIIKTIDEATRTQEVRLTLEDKNINLPTGYSGRLEWNNSEKKIPAEFIQRRNADLGVMIAEDIVENVGKAKFVALKNAIEGQPAIVDLPGNTAIINNNQFRVNDGESIRLQNN